MSTKLNVENGIKANLRCPNNSTITMDHVNSNNDDCDNDAALDVFINKCVGESKCTITDKELKCPGNIDVVYTCIDENGKQVNKAGIDASVDVGDGDDFNFNGTITNTSTFGSTVNDNTNSAQTSMEESEEALLTAQESINSSEKASTITTTNNELDDENNYDENNYDNDEDEESNTFFENYGSMMTSIACLILIGVVLFFGWKLFKKYNANKLLSGTDSASVISSTSSFGSSAKTNVTTATAATNATTSSAKASSSSINL
jgi:hypothetical protein